MSAILRMPSRRELLAGLVAAVALGPIPGTLRAAAADVPELFSADLRAAFRPLSPFEDF